MYINFTVEETNTATDRQIWGKNCTKKEATNYSATSKNIILWSLKSIYAIYNCV